MPAFLACLSAASAALFQPAAADPAARIVAVSGVVELPEGALAFVPPGLEAPAPLLVLLHGGGGSPKEMLGRFRDAAVRRGIILLAPKSTGATWDMVEEIGRARRALVRTAPTARLSVDPPRINRAFHALRPFVHIDPGRVAIGGFSDGATYALTVGTANPPLFRTLLIFSPGMAYLSGGDHAGQRLFLSHGRKDPVLSFDASRSRFVPALIAAGLQVTFRPFDGLHEIPDDVLDDAFTFWLGPADR
ncbi:hypothetical protein [Sphingomonas sp.]|uniref:alpha/beta hydrolase n=1 Tax=Sphingomonas sp. TaxID=28214 RepID=UPI0025E96785|nr:hypothetical protein [Sphingomonas sp.]